MGACMSSMGGGEMLVEAPDGDQKAFHERFIEEDVLGEGEFGVVKRVFEASNPKVPLACKTLKKGMVFKDNQLYPALPPEMLRGEIEVLRALKGKDTYCLQLHSVYESPKAILMITELCAGGEMMEYVAKLDSDLRTEDVSRIAFQLLTAIDFCAKKGIIHRDLKPANIMFESNDPKSDLRVIDFGAGCKNDPNDKESGKHTTFAGTPFYNSPEMFAHKYTQKTDVFSVGVTLYVLVAGYPADQLQKAFNVLQNSSKGAKRNLRNLPNMPQNMPESYYDMLEGLLTYQPRHRKAAGEMLTHPFATFYQDLAKEEADEQAPAAPKRPSMFKRQSFLLTGTAERHNLMLGYQKFERSLTALLATMLQQDDLQRLMDLLKARLDQINELLDEETEHTAASAGSFSEQIESKAPNAGQLAALPLPQVVKLVEDDLGNEELVNMINNLPNANKYRTYAYHTDLLLDFVKPTTATNSLRAEGPAGGARRHSSMTKGRGMGLSGSTNSAPNSRSLRNLGSSFRNLRSSSNANKPKPFGGEFNKFGSSPTQGPAGMRRAQSVMIKGV